MFPTKEEFEILLKTTDIDSIIDNHLFGGAPFYSSHQPQVHRQMVRQVSRGLKVPKQDICVVGSGRIGFSLAPQKFGEPFGQFSDLDIVVVSAELFDPSWLDILTIRLRNRPNITRQTRYNLQSHRENHYIHNGWIYPSSVIEALDIGQLWLRTFNGLSRITELAGRQIGARLYRTWDHARTYHRRGLVQLRRQLLDHGLAEVNK